MNALLVAALVLVSVSPKAIQFNLTAAANPGWTACTSGTYCLTGYTLFEITTSATVEVASIPQAATAYSMPLPAAGSHTYVMAQNGLDGSGAVVQSAGNHGATIYCQKIPGTSWRKCVVKKEW